MRRKVLSLCIVALALAVGAVRPADEDTRPDDERILKQAGVATDDAGLLAFFRTSGPSEDEIRALVKKLGDDSFEVREKASAALAGLGRMAEPFLREALKSGDAEVVRRAEECLKHTGEGPSVTVASAAARLLARRKPRGAAEVLLAYAPRVAGQPGEEAVGDALAALAVRDGKADPALVKALEDKSPGRRVTAAVALARGGARDQLPAIRKLLEDVEPSVRLQTALALAAVKEKEAVPVLIDLLAVLPRSRHAPIEEVLYRLAEDKAPEGLVGDDEAARKNYRDAWAEWWKRDGDKADLAKLTQAGKFLGYTMIVMLDAGRIFEVDADGKTRWQIDGLDFPLDAQGLPGDRVLVAEYQAARVTERDRKGNILWEKRVAEPLAAQRLPNGNTFIATRNSLLEVDRAGRQVGGNLMQQDGLIMKAQKLDKGEVGVVVTTGGPVQFVRLDASGKQLAAFPVEVRTSGGRIDVLPNGHVLVPLKDQNKVVEYDGTGKPVWQADFPQPVAAVRMPNGHTIVTSYEDKRAVELDGDGKQVWEFKAGGRVTRAWRR
jgi:outer membrane protein assembly factor BamB